MEIAGLHLEEVDLRARAGDEPRGAGRVETLSLAPEQRARPVPHVVGQHPADETLGARIGRDERVRLHARASGATPASAGGAAAASRASARIGLAITRGRPVPP